MRRSPANGPARCRKPIRDLVLPLAKPILLPSPSALSSFVKKTAANQKAPKSSEPECLELLNEFVKTFQSIPQRYCLFWEANAGLGMEAHKPDYPFRRASELVRINPLSIRKGLPRTPRGT